tara:strand:+ start:2822 stop:3493 length:672 start_codon:yes stop_codon:yes gene_type:complete
MSITENIQKIKSNLPKNVTLVAVSKTKPIEDLQEAYNTGQRIFGENKIQEMTQKWEALPKDIEWHMIGNLQRNKIKYMAEYVSLIHGVENFKTLQEINKQALKHHRIINCLLQIKIAKEDTKAGMTLAEAKNILCSEEFSNMKNVHVNGLMGMATFTENKEQLNDEFNSLKTYSEELKELDSTNCNLQTISMGMSGDYTLAINCGSTMVRVGSSIFGVRNYKI